MLPTCTSMRPGTRKQHCIVQRVAGQQAASVVMTVQNSSYLQLADRLSLQAGPEDNLHVPNATTLCGWLSRGCCHPFYQKFLGGPNRQLAMALIDAVVVQICCCQSLNVTSGVSHSGDI